MLGKRYENDGKPGCDLNDLQKSMKKQVDEKIARGIYTFESVPCLVCDKKESEVLSQKDRHGFYSPAVICKQCGLIQLNPRMTQGSYDAFYNNEYIRLYLGQENPAQDFFNSQYLRGEKIFSFLKKAGVFQKPLSEVSVLEVGCNCGGILHYFRQKGCSVKGIDLNREYVNFGRERYGLDLAYGTLADVELNIPPDLVIYSHVFEHILYPKDESARLGRTLKEGAAVYIEIPGVKNLMKSYDTDFLKLLQNAHTTYFSLTTLKNLFETSGFKTLVGDETIRGVFVKSPGPDGKAFANDYDAVMRYLRRLEGVRKITPFPLYKIAYLPKRFLLGFLKITGLYGLMKKIFWSVKKNPSHVHK